jgi:type III pantothenate kinase
MLLAINANNTNFKFAIFDGETLRDEWKIATNATRTADEYFVWLGQLMELKGITADDIEDVIIATVVPQAMFNLRGLCETYFHCRPYVIGENVELGVKILIDRPEEAGADRVVNAFAAKHFYGGPAIVLDFGTATSFDVADKDGNFIGGVIAPGINLSVEALYMAAARLPHISIEKPSHVIGKGTVEAMRSGVFWGYVGLFEGVLARIKAEFGDPAMKVIATGGLTPLFIDSTDMFDHVDADLTMKGLQVLYQQNKEAAA